MIQNSTYLDLRKYDMSKSRWTDRDFNPFQPIERTKKNDKIRIGLLVSFSGSDALWGPAGQYSGVLAAALINASGGILGKEIELYGADSGGSPEEVVRRVEELVNIHHVDVLVGTHLSNIRVAVRDAFSHKLPYIYSTQYEGGDNTRGVFAIGETPEKQYRDSINWMVKNMGAKKWYLMGNDYVWPRETHPVIHRLIEEAGGEVVGTEYVPLGRETHSESLHKIAEAAPDVVFESLVGADCITFNQEFGASGLSDGIARLSGVIEENVLMGIGEDNSQNLYAVSAYFNSIETDENKSFLYEYEAAFGETAPVQGCMSQTCYEGIFFLAALAKQAGSLDIDDLVKAGRDISYSGARGTVKISNACADMDHYLMKSNGYEYELIHSFKS